MRKTTFAAEEYYHLYNRGNNKQNIFSNQRDYVRFLFLLFALQTPPPLYNASRNVDYFIKHGKFNLTQKQIDKAVENRHIELINFTLMPNHYHLMVYDKTGTGISSYMQRLQDSYTKYWNTKYINYGHLFQGPFQAVHIDSNEQLLYLSAYIHKNPGELGFWKGKESSYPWSSYYDYSGENRWGKLLSTDILLKQFKNKEEYSYFVNTSNAKEKLDDNIILES